MLSAVIESEAIAMVQNTCRGRGKGLLVVKSHSYWVYLENIAIIPFVPRTHPAPGCLRIHAF